MSPSLWDPPVTQRDSNRGPLQIATCSLCGLELPLGLMVPDGGEACADLRWYCKDAQSCTQRWTVRGSAAGPEPDEPEPAGQLISTPDDA
jgi:hypothetical protein